MARIVSYIDGHRLALPTLAVMFPTDLGAVDGRRYLSVPDDFDIPDQDAEAELVLHTEPLPSDIRSRLLKVREIDNACVARIRDRYSVDDELGALRTGDQIVLDYITACVSEAKAAKTALGL